MKNRKRIKSIISAVMIFIIVSGTIFWLMDYTSDKVKVTIMDYPGESYVDREVTDGRVNLNRASAETLEMLDGIGEKTAHAIIDYRTVNGAFESIEELLDVKGIGEKTLEEIKDKVYVD